MSASAQETTWRDYANCLGSDPDKFFPPRGGDSSEPKEICRSCVVREDCLEYALANGEKFGIWGGTGESERRILRRQRALARSAASSATTAQRRVAAKAPPEPHPEPTPEPDTAPAPEIAVQQLAAFGALATAASATPQPEVHQPNPNLSDTTV